MYESDPKIMALLKRTVLPKPSTSTEESGTGSSEKTNSHPLSDDVSGSVHVAIETHRGEVDLESARQEIQRCILNSIVARRVLYGNKVSCHFCALIPHTQRKNTTYKVEACL